ncbi:hypothetical protein J437_LFUL004305 [Ladona fulva]|uniref:Uncharacterized protein n=1 Tax=Ladona fulva TaxID=123851 RepID=A0A8K0JXN0_LADFU|nr:hypothetical protein J437_LFUL004305 [Ladona fulva]
MTKSSTGSKVSRSSPLTTAHMSTWSASSGRRTVYAPVGNVNHQFPPVNDFVWNDSPCPYTQQDFS